MSNLDTIHYRETVDKEKLTYMVKNLGTIDRVIRLVIALALLPISFAFYQTNFILAIIAFVLALGTAITVITGFCIVYKLFGISTRKDSGGSSPPSQPMQ